jgi:oligopeptide transport system permease protein
MFCIILLVFAMVHLTAGNPFSGEKALSPEVLKQLMHEYRLDLPLWKQFILYINDLLHGNFGYSYKFRGQLINDLLFPDNMGGFWETLNLALYSMAFAIPLGVIFGAYAGIHKNSWFDKLVIATNMVFSAIPTIVTGPLMVLIFAVTLSWLPSSGWGGFSHLFLPVLILTLAYAPTIAFVTRGSILDVLNSNFIRTAHAKGLSTFSIIFKHAIRPTMIPVVSLLGPMFAGILVGTIVTEQVFALPGLGILTTNAAVNRDYNLILAITIFGSFLTIFFNLVVDILYFILDPKIKQ